MNKSRDYEIDGLVSAICDLKAAYDSSQAENAELRAEIKGLTDERTVSFVEIANLRAQLSEQSDSESDFDLIRSGLVPEDKPFSAKE